VRIGESCLDELLYGSREMKVEDVPLLGCISCGRRLSKPVNFRRFGAPMPLEFPVRPRFSDPILTTWVTGALCT